MSCEKRTSESRGDCLEVGSESRPFDLSATAWLVGQGVRYLNTVGKEGELHYQHVIELMRRCGKDVTETVNGLFRQANSGDAPLRWCLLYVLGDAGDESAADFLVRTALKQLPEACSDQGCEGPRDAEMLVCTMAVHALRRIAGRHPEVSEQLLKIVSERPARPILIEAVKVAGELGLIEKIREILPKEDHWILDIRRARTEELFAESEREDGKERGFTPPKTGAQYTAPHVTCCTRKEN
ncbi:MAG: exonuclease SbcCD subunit D C-terminal domain-containing protein [Gammaproteobacteria bacterium]